MEGFEERKKQAEQWLSESLQQWKKQAQPFWSQAQECIEQVPPSQIYAALALMLITSLFLLGMHSCYLIFQISKIDIYALYLL